MLKFLTRFSALMAVLIVSALPLDAFAIRPRYKAVSYNTSRPAFERLVRGLTPTMDIRPGKSTTTDLESIRVSQIDSTIGSVSFTQATDANKPLLTEGGRREQLFTATESQTQSAWTKSELTASASVEVHPEGATVYKLIENGSNSTHQQYVGSLPVPIGSTRFQIDAKPEGSRSVSLRFSTNFTAGYAHFDLSDGSVDSVTGSTTAEAIDIGSGWYRLIAYAPATATAAQVHIYLTATPGSTTYTGDSASGVHLAKQILQRATMSPTYIPTNALPRHGSLTGQRGLYFDGSDDELDTTSTFGDILGASAKTVFSLTTPYQIAASELYFDDAPGYFGMYFNSNESQVYNSDGSTDVIGVAATILEPELLSVWHDGTTLSMDRNGTQDSAASGATAQTTNVLDLGHRNGSNNGNVSLSRLTTFNKVIPTSTRQRLIKGFKRFYRVN